MAGYATRGKSTRVTVRLPGGGRESDTFDTKAEAEAWAAKMEVKKAAGTLTPSSGRTVRELLDTYLEQVASKTDSARWNTMRLTKWSMGPLAPLKVAAVTTHTMNEWMSARLKNPVRKSSADTISGSTVNREMNLWSAAFTYGIESLKWLTANPCHRAARPAESPPRSRALLTVDEIRAIRLAGGYDADPGLLTASARVTACFLFALETGMRSGEILRLRPRDYNAAERTVVVAALEVGGRKGSKSGKVRNPGRVVPLTGQACELLERLVDSMPDDQKPAAGFLNPPFVVGIKDGSRDTLFRKIRDRAGIEDLTFHDTKHEAATRLAKVVDVLVLSHAIGTKDIRLLRDTYYVNNAAAVALTLPQKLTDTVEKNQAEAWKTPTTEVKTIWPQLHDA
jgi:integrase